MALNNIQERIERSIYEIIRLKLVQEGYLPDIKDVAFEKAVDNFNLSPAGETAWKQAIQGIAASKQFAAELFNNSSPASKGLKKVPRIVIVPQRLVEGDLGLPPGFSVVKKVNDPNSLQKFLNPTESVGLSIDIHIVYDSTTSGRVLNSIVSESIGQKGFLTFYDNPKERFFIKQINYFDIPDTQESIVEKVYSYEVQDLYLFSESSNGDVSRIKEITVETTDLELESIIAQNGTIIGPYVNDGKLFIDLSGIKFM